MKMNEIRARIMEEAHKRIKQAEKDYTQGKTDCKKGNYDKWYRYNRDDSGQAYDAGWEEENKRVKNEKVTFIEIKIF